MGKWYTKKHLIQLILIICHVVEFLSTGLETGLGMFFMLFSSSAVVCVHYWILEGQHFTFELPKVVGDKSC